MSVTGNHQPAAPGNREISSTRVFDAPRELVFRAFSDPHLLADEAGKTRLTLVMQFESAAEAEKVRSLVAEANEQNFDRLEAQLADPSQPE